MNHPYPHPANDYDSEDGFNSTSSTDVEDNDTLDNAPKGISQANQPPIYQVQTPLCIVCQKKPPYSKGRKQYPTCGLACAAKVSNVSMCCVCGTRPSYSNGSKSYPTCGLTCAAKLKAGTSSLAGTSQTQCVVCGVRPRYSNGTKKYTTCGLTCAERLKTLCDYCHKKPKAKNDLYCGSRCKGLSKSACLMCRSRPKNGKYHFCGKTCRDNARSMAPLILEVPRGHSTFDMVEIKFQKAWKYGTCPAVRKIYKVVENLNFLIPYDNYLKQHGNEVFRYHGTQRSCNLGDEGQRALCTSLSCPACSILKTSYQVKFAKASGAFGAGVYTSSAANKSASYSSGGVMFLNKVVLGKVHNVNAFGSVSSCPPGCQSVVFDRNNGTLNETIVYTNDAIRPVFLVMFG
ncbi:hypothetical protein PILCRDRAFT_829822 [Piloderma croceum F 1598]|uniref:PARP catalytic domain-containing protein n=1 Tax=Piloderma croceum (strain F 1598) TaxID=765440 RepID=A0A0C3EX35_PILCF|nr:hypothetical protein PILCRDRAFT_829822 [Piloderma croceum F 1598]